jgi:hypothetical protein
LKDPATTSGSGVVDQVVDGSRPLVDTLFGVAPDAEPSEVASSSLFVEVVAAGDFRDADGVVPLDADGVVPLDVDEVVSLDVDGVVGKVVGWAEGAVRSGVAVCSVSLSVSVAAELNAYGPAGCRGASIRLAPTAASTPTSTARSGSSLTRARLRAFVVTSGLAGVSPGNWVSSLIFMAKRVTDPIPGARPGTRVCQDLLKRSPLHRVAVPTPEVSFRRCRSPYGRWTG